MFIYKSSLIESLNKSYFANHGSIIKDLLSSHKPFGKRLYYCHLTALMCMDLSLLFYVLSSLLLNHFYLFGDHIIVGFTPQAEVNLFGKIFSEIFLNGYGF